jgi:very-short-patch-repair endonuclease
VWAIAKKDHDVVTHDELRALGYSRDAIKHRVKTNRLHPQALGVYSVGSPNLTKYGRWMVAIKRCGPETVLSHLSAAVLWGIRKKEGKEIRVTVPRRKRPRVKGASRRDLPARHVTRHHGIPVTTVLRTLIDLAPVLTREEMERLIGQADALNLLRADTLREQLEREACRGARILKAILDRDSYALSHSELERLFIPLALEAGIGKPDSQRRFGKYRVDFFFEELNLVVECNSLRYHRTQLQQRKDTERGHAHLLESRTCVPFTHHQVAHEPAYVVRILSAAAAQLAAAAPSTRTP